MRAFVFPFDERKALLDTGDREIDFHMVEIGSDIVLIEECFPSCNKKDLGDGAFEITFHGLPFNRWKSSCLEKIAKSLDEVLLVTNFQNLQVMKLLIVGVRPKLVPRMIEVAVHNAWY
uniref:DUF4283 domain-containing protein n=1 Tax=Nelumbo nucifera TaxID=4432 RepID=A0A822XEQ1_NELNU|nr:TPA_asm: hypothetical protein HUJ06_020130 [Nelumbo nucifera]